MHGALFGLVILVIGDSHMIYMLSNLHNALEDAGATVHSYAMCGETATDWLDSSTVVPWAACGRGERHGTEPPLIENQKGKGTYALPALINQYHPNLIVVELGDTMGGFGAAPLDRSWASTQVRTLVGRIAASNISCDWVGPIWGHDEAPYHKTDARVREMSQFLSASVAPCKYIDSTGFARPGEWPTRDGTHLQPDGYRRWSKAIAEAIIRSRDPAAR
jgi:hypothetical protein